MKDTNVIVYNMPDNCHKCVFETSNYDTFSLLDDYNQVVNVCLLTSEEVTEKCFSRPWNCPLINIEDFLKYWKGEILNELCNSRTN